MFLYAWHPDSHGPLSFFVMENTEETAIIAVQKWIDEQKQQGLSSYFIDNWPKNHELEVFSPGEVAVNNND